MKKFLSLLFSLFILSCKENNLKNFPIQSENGFFQMVVEIPAGTNKKYEFDSESLTFIVDQRDGKDRIINYLPYPGNYGFIPSTYCDPETGGDGDPVDVILLCESLPQGSLVEIIPIGTIKLMDNQEEDYKIIAVPATDELNHLGIKTWEEFQAQNKGISSILEIWLKNYDSDDLEIKGWLNQVETMDYIEKRQIKF